MIAIGRRCRWKGLSLFGGVRVDRVCTSKFPTAAHPQQAMIEPKYDRFLL
jgi:hypothetical protein